MKSRSRREISRRKALSMAAGSVGASSVLAGGFPAIVAELGRGALLASDLEDAPRPVDGVAEGPALGDGERRRLLQVDVLPGLHRRDRDERVPVVGGADDDRVHVRAREDGIRFEGTEGWVFVSRGNESVTASDPVAKLKDPQALAASDPKILTSVIAPDEIHLYESGDHHGNWLDCIRSRQPPIAPVEVGHRSCSTCLLHHIAMKTQRALHWDPLRERFKNDDEANAMLSRSQRWPFSIA